MNQPCSEHEQIFAAAADGDSVRLFALLDANESLLNATNAVQKTPLLVALKENHIESACQLIERGANAFVVSHSDDWAMRQIVERNVFKKAERERLVNAAIAAKVWDDEIFHAVWKRDHKRAKAILASDPQRASTLLANADGDEDFRSTLPYCGMSPLHYAVLAGDKRMVGLLLEAGAEVDAVPHAHKPDSRYTPMMFVPNGCDGIAQLLVDYGANVRHTSFYLSSGSKSMRKVVVENGAAGTPLLTALILRQFDKAAKIACDDPSVIHNRLPGAYLDSPLHLAVDAGCAPVVEALLKHGMDVDTPTAEGSTALTLASEVYAPLEMFKLLVKHGADVRDGGDAPIYGAIWQHAYRHYNYESVIRFLVRQGARPRGLCHCAQAGNLSATKLLVELGADVNETCDDGWPLLNCGHTPLDYCTGVAGEREYKKLAEFLRQHGAKHATELT